MSAAAADRALTTPARGASLPGQVMSGRAIGTASDGRPLTAELADGRAVGSFCAVGGLRNLNLGARGCVIIVLHARPEAGGNLAERTGGWRRPAIHVPGPGQEPAAVLPRWLSFPAALGPFRSSAMRAIAGGSCAGRLPVCLLTVLSRRGPMRLTGHVTNPGSDAGPNGGQGPYRSAE